MLWPAAVCSLGRACLLTATPGNSRPFCRELDACPRVVRSLGLACSDPALKDCEACGRTEFSPHSLQPAPGNQSQGIRMGELESAFSLYRCGNCRPERRGHLRKEVEPKPTFLSGALPPFGSTLHFVTVLDFQEACGAVKKAHVLQMVLKHPRPRPHPISRLHSLASSCASVLCKPLSGNRLPFSHLFAL